MGYHASYFCHSEDGLLAATAFWISFQQPNVFSGWWCIKCLYTDNIPVCFSCCIWDHFYPSKHSPTIFVVCMCIFFAISMTLALWLCLHCNLCRTASTRRVKMPCQSLIHWLTCILFCLAWSVCTCVYVLAHVHIYVQQAFDHSYPNHIQFFLFHFMKLLLVFGTVCLHPAMLFSMRKTDSDGVGPGSWPLRWLTVALVSRCRPPHSLPCPSTPNLMISNGHQANHSITHTTV